MKRWSAPLMVTDGVLHVKRKPRGGAETSHYVAAVTSAAGADWRQAAHDPFGARRATDWICTSGSI